MTIFLNLRGTNGAGKTTLARRFFDGQSPADTLRWLDKTPYHDLGTRWLLGRYDRATCGGCDTIKTQDEVCLLLRTAAARGVPLVVFEGLLLSGLWTRYYNLDVELTGQGHTVWWAFLDTPLALSIERTNARRAARGVGPLEDVTNLAAKHRSVEMCRTRAVAHGCRTLVLPPDAEQAYSWLHLSWEGRDAFIS